MQWVSEYAKIKFDAPPPGQPIKKNKKNFKRKYVQACYMEMSTKTGYENYEHRVLAGWWRWWGLKSWRKKRPNVRSFLWLPEATGGAEQRLVKKKKREKTKWKLNVVMWYSQCVCVCVYKSMYMVMEKQEREKARWRLKL